MKVLFVTSPLTMGGLQRVTGVIADGLAQYSAGCVQTSLFVASERGLRDLFGGKRPGDGIESNVTPFYQVKTRVFAQSDNALSLLRRKALAAIHRVFPRMPHGASFEIASIVKREHVDAVIVNPWFYKALPGIKAICPNVRVVMWTHNGYDTYTQRYFSTKQQQVVLQRAAHAADDIICVNSETVRGWRGQFEREHANYPRIHVLHNPITLDSQGMRSSLENPVIAMSCRLVIHNKGLDYAVQLAKQLPEPWCIRIAGDGPDRAELERMIADAGVAQRVELVGGLQGQALREHYASASMLLLPSRWEGFPLVAGEAMAFGLPVVAFDIPAMRDVAGDCGAALMAKLSETSAVGAADTADRSSDQDVALASGADALYRTMLPLLESIEERRAQSERSLQRASQLALPKIVQQWETMLNKRS